MDAVRAEFPGATAALAPLRRVSVSAAKPMDAFLAGIGAAFLVRAVVALLVDVLFPVLFPNTSPRPAWLSPSLLQNGAAEIAAGLVLVRAGGAIPLAGYAVFQVLVLVAALPGRLEFCARGPGFPDTPCDLPSMVVARWPLWLALVIGVLLSRALARSDAGENTTLRAAGVIALVITVAGNAATAVFYLSGSAMPPTVVTGVVAVAHIVAGLVAGALLWRSPLASPLLIALCLLGPSLAGGVPVLRANLSHTSGQPFAYYLDLWSGIVVPALGAVALFAGRALRREWGTIV